MSAAFRAFRLSARRCSAAAWFCSCCASALSCSALSARRTALASEPPGLGAQRCELVLDLLLGLLEGVEPLLEALLERRTVRRVVDAALEDHLVRADPAQLAEQGTGLGGQGFALLPEGVAVGLQQGLLRSS